MSLENYLRLAIGEAQRQNYQRLIDIYMCPGKLLFKRLLAFEQRTKTQIIHDLFFLTKLPKDKQAMSIGF